MQEKVGYARYQDFCKSRHRTVLHWMERIDYLFFETTLVALGSMGKGHFVTQESYPIGVDSTVSLKELSDFLDEEGISYEVSKSALGGDIHDVICIRDFDCCLQLHIFKPLLIQSLGGQCTPLDIFRDLIFD